MKTFQLQPVDSRKSFYGKCRVEVRNKTINLGLFDTVKEAHNKYIECKKEYIKELANEYKGKLSERVYNRLCNF